MNIAKVSDHTEKEFNIVRLESDNNSIETRREMLSENDNSFVIEKMIKNIGIEENIFNDANDTLAYFLKATYR